MLKPFKNTIVDLEPRVERDMTKASDQLFEYFTKLGLDEALSNELAFGLLIYKNFGHKILRRTTYSDALKEYNQFLELVGRVRLKTTDSMRVFSLFRGGHQNEASKSTVKSDLQTQE